MRKSRLTHVLTEYIENDKVLLIVDEIVDSYGDYVTFEDLFIEFGKKQELLDPSEDEVTEIVKQLGFDNLIDLCEHIAENGNIDHGFINEYED